MRGSKDTMSSPPRERKPNQHDRRCFASSTSPKTMSSNLKVELQYHFNWFYLFFHHDMTAFSFWLVAVYHLLLLVSLVHSSSGAEQWDRSYRRLQHLSRAFQRVWDGNEIHTERLFEACGVFASTLKETGPQAVRRDFNGNLHKAKVLVNNDAKKCHPRIKMNLGAALLYERDTKDIHVGNKLKDPSGAVGVLWMRRSLEFQTEFYSGLIRGKRPNDAALAAYRTQLQPFHGPVMRQLYTTFFRYKMPKRDTVLRRLGGWSSDDMEHEEELVLKDLKLLIQTWRPILEKWKAYFVELDMEDTRQV